MPMGHIAFESRRNSCISSDCDECGAVLLQRVQLSILGVLLGVTGATVAQSVWRLGYGLGVPRFPTFPVAARCKTWVCGRLLARPPS